MKGFAPRWMVLWLLVTGATAHAGGTARPSIVVFAAASLTNVLQELGDGFTRETGSPVTFSFAASSTLARQIENGAPADIFFSADIEWMDYLQSRKLIQIATRQNVLGNRLVLVAPADSRINLRIAPNFPLAATLGSNRLTTGDPAGVPVGRYAQEALTRLGVWNSIEKQLVRADSVRSALAFVDRGEAALGVVYQTDALIDGKVRVVDVFPESTHAPITYPIALTTLAWAKRLAPSHTCSNGTVSPRVGHKKPSWHASTVNTASSARHSKD